MWRKVNTFCDSVCASRFCCRFPLFESRDYSAWACDWARNTCVWIWHQYNQHHKLIICQTNETLMLIIFNFTVGSCERPIIYRSHTQTQLQITIFALFGSCHTHPHTHPQLETDWYRYATVRLQLKLLAVRSERKPQREDRDRAITHLGR